jgi:hypothetical protein
MSIFSDIPLERLATVFMRRDPKAMAFKIAVIEANVLMRELYKAEPGTYERALAWQSAGTAAHTAERLYLEAVPEKAKRNRLYLQMSSKKFSPG